MRLLRQLFLHNWHLKLVSLTLAFLLWALYTSEPLAEVGYQVPLEFHNVPAALMLADDVPMQVHVRLRGRSVALRRLTPADLAIAVDLASASVGETLVRLTAHHVKTPSGAEVVRISPSELRLRLIPRDAAAR